MLVRFIVRLLLWSFLAFVVLAVFAGLAIDIGLADQLFGVGARSWLHGWVDLLRKHYGLNRANIDLALKIIGLAGTITFGMLGLVHAWYFGRINLPARLAQYADRLRALHIVGRSVILAPYATRNLKGDQTPLAPTSVLRRTQWLLKLDARSRSIRRLTASTQTLDGDIQVLEAKLRLRKSERITCHLIDGSKLAAQAKLLPDGSAAQRDRNSAALVEFQRAVALDDTDLDALELTAKQARLMNSKTVTLRSLVRLEGVSQQRPARHARALRLHAEFIAENSTKKAALGEARMKLEAALEALSEQEDGAEKPLELALVNEQLARLHLRRKTLTLVAPYLNDADALYGEMPPPEGLAGRARIEALRAELVRAQLGGDDPDGGP